METSLPAAAPSASPEMDYAGFWIRVVAWIIDAILLSIVGTMIILFFGGMAANPETGASPIATLLQVVAGFLYMTLLWSSNMQGTLGQKVCGLQVVNSSDGARISFLRAASRYLGLIVACAILLIGVIMVAFTARKQGLHDMIAGTYVIKAR